MDLYVEQLAELTPWTPDAIRTMMARGIFKRLVVDQRQLQQIATQRLSIRAAAQVLRISPSSYLRLLRAQAAHPGVDQRMGQ